MNNVMRGREEKGELNRIKQKGKMGSNETLIT